MPNVWIFQDPKQVAKHGKAKAAFYVGWYDPEGKRRCKSCGAGSFGKREAKRLRRKRRAELIGGNYQSPAKKTWKDFRKYIDTLILPGLSVTTRYEVRGALKHFERIIRPVIVSALRTAHIDRYAAVRRGDDGKVKGSKVSAATINKELRHLKAVFRKCQEEMGLKDLPKFHRQRETPELRTYVPPEHFAALYHACKAAKLPKRKTFTAADWWKGLLIMAYLTGWRIGALLALRREDVDFEKATAVSRAVDVKGKRGVKTPLHSIVIEHLKRIPGFSPVVFPWPHPRRRLYDEFELIQEAAGVRPEGRKEHYGFHDLRRAFATLNADRLTAEQLQTIMQHKSFQTTLGYIDRARKMNPALQNVFVPDLSGQAGRSGK
jgi:integrase